VRWGIVLRCEDAFRSEVRRGAKPISMFDLAEPRDEIRLPAHRNAEPIRRSE
jgi:hypothetical protein